MKHVFIDTFPDDIQDGVIYISMKYGTAVHKCPCGCGNEVITPFDEEFGWILNFNGKSISLSPSIGNWNLPCKSHYWIKNDSIIWASKKWKKKRKKFYWFFNL